MFDPEKVDRFDLDRGAHHDDGIMAYCEHGDYVRASDYDALLKLYRAREQRIRDLATLFGVCDGGRYMEDWKARAASLGAIQQRGLESPQPGGYGPNHP